jgi:hypothetical protein
MAKMRPGNLDRLRRSVSKGSGRLILASAIAGMSLLPTTALAAGFRLDTSLPGADFDAILDGFPGLATLDGAGDLAGNSLAVSLKSGVTEERAIVELPLASLSTAGIVAAQITSATLHFNIDDVLSTFGPGTDFDGTAGERIDVAVYSGDGAVDLPDFAAGSAAGSVSTGPQGSITDASLRSSGPIDFSIDLTSTVKQLVAAGATHVGIVLSTDDSATGTSIDDRGDGGTGSPGTGGATMPYLEIVTADTTPTPAPTATPSPTPTATAPVVTPSPSPTPGVGPTAPPTPFQTPTPTSGPGVTPTPVVTGPTPSPGQVTPQPTVAPTPTNVATEIPATPTPQGSSTPAVTPTVTATPSGSATPGASSTPGATRTPGASPTPAATTTPNGGLTPTPRPVLTASPRPTPTSGSTAPTPSPTVDDGSLVETVRPEASGDQLVFYFDTREGFTTFLNLHNLGSASLRVRIGLCDATLTLRLEQDLDIGAGTTRTLDLASLRSSGLPATVGAAFVSAIDEAGEARVSRALAGSFTVANLATGSAWGAPAAARRAVVVDGGQVTTPALGTAIDGDLVRLQRIRPTGLDLAVYYDPTTLEPAEIGGNQLVLLSFDGDGAPVAASTVWQLDAHRSDGVAFSAAPITVSGVSLTHVTALLGEAAEGAAGSIHFATEDGAHNRLVFFVQSIGTFATGYLLTPITP